LTLESKGPVPFNTYEDMLMSEGSMDFAFDDEETLSTRSPVVDFEALGFWHATAEIAAAIAIDARNRE
jgi:hypothetical protein